MKERIYTIPVNDAFNEECECALCKLEEKTEKDLSNYFLGASLMEPGVRMVTNEKGFCRKHFTQLYIRQENRLGLGLMLHTHFIDLCEDLNKKLTKAVPSQNAGIFFGHKGDYRDTLLKAAEMVKKRMDSCTFCDRIDYTMDRYIDVILWQYFEDKTFRERFVQTKGFCLPHLALLLQGAAKYLSHKEAALFVKDLSILQNQSMDTSRDELEWFTQKFDYKNEDKPWKNSRDAIPRAIRKIVSNTDLKQ